MYIPCRFYSQNRTASIRQPGQDSQDSVQRKKMYKEGQAAPPPSPIGFITPEAVSNRRFVGGGGGV
jgi:hypothetical protein